MCESLLDTLQLDKGCAPGELVVVPVVLAEVVGALAELEDVPAGLVIVLAELVVVVSALVDVPAVLPVKLGEQVVAQTELVETVAAPAEPVPALTDVGGPAWFEGGVSGNIF